MVGGGLEYGPSHDILTLYRTSEVEKTEEDARDNAEGRHGGEVALHS